MDIAAADVALKDVGELDLVDLDRARYVLGFLGPDQRRPGEGQHHDR